MLVVLLALGAFALVRSSTSVTIRHMELRYPNLPAGLDGFTILLVSDLHSHRFGAGQRDLLRRLSSEQWDVSVLGGDYVIDPETKDPAAYTPAADLVQGLSARAPCYYVLGNYEGDGTYSYYPMPGVPVVAALEAAGGVSVYPAVRIEHGGAFLWLSDWSRRPYGAGASTWPEWGAFPSALDDSRDFVITVTHRPLDLENRARIQLSSDLIPPDGTWRPADAIRWDLSLSGHTHGGQWRLPGDGPLVSNVEEGHLPLGLLPLHGDRYVQGVTRIEDETGVRYQVITSGIAESGWLPLRFRLFSHREALLITLRAV